MATGFTDPERNIIPRWRPSSIVGMQDLAALRSAPRLFPADDTLEQLVQDWNAHHSPRVAADLVGAAFVLNKTQVAKDAAEYLLSSGAASETARSLALQVVGRASDVGHHTPDQSDEPEAQIHSSRLALAIEPRNPLLWMDVAREYTVLAQLERAERAVRIALALAPDHRFILRAAVRFYLHVGLPDRAHDVVRRSGRTPEDPWLVAAELIAASKAGRSSKLVKRARVLVDSKRFLPAHTSELATALAMLELEAGSRRNGKKLFDTALIDPNENAIAQAAWAARRGFIPEVRLERFHAARTYEASAWTHYLAGRWGESIEAAHDWLVDEPFASRPAAFGSFVSSAVAEDFEDSIWFAERGHRADPTNVLLINNLAFAKALAGDMKGARAAIGLVHAEDVGSDVRVAVLATMGLIAFRSGETRLGRASYESAIKTARQLKADAHLVGAQLYQAREEIRAGSDVATQLLQDAEAALPTVKGPMKLVLGIVLQRAKQELAQALTLRAGS